MLHAFDEPAYSDGGVTCIQRSLGQQQDRADGGLDLVTDVRDEVPSNGFDPLFLGHVLGDDRDVLATQREGVNLQWHRSAGQVRSRQRDPDATAYPVAAHLM